MKMNLKKRRIAFPSIYFFLDFCKKQIHNKASSSEKVNPLLSSHIKIYQNIWLELFLLSWFRWDNFFLLKILFKFITNTHLSTSQDVNWWTRFVWITGGLLWCFNQLFGLSFWRHPFATEDPLVSKWYNATFLQIGFDEETNSSAHPEGEYIFSKFSILGKLLL